MGGRGSGKTRAGAEWVRELAAGKSGRAFSGPIALVSETIAQARAVMVEGTSGILSIGPVSDRPRFDQGRNMLVWKNGSEALLMSASEPERFRGPQFAAAWCDELAKWPNAEAAWDMLQFGLRLGDRPRQMVTTTPRPTKLLRRILADDKTVVTGMRTSDNASNLAPGFLDQIVGRYQGTFLGRQELDGELIEDLPDALWLRADLEAAVRAKPPELERVLVSVDPAVSSNTKSDACGIIVAARFGEQAIVLADKTLKPAPPLKWARRVVAAYHRFDADAVVAEVNQGGDLVVSMIAQVDPAVPVIKVRANRSKWVRAEPVAALYQRGLVHHVPGLGELEDEMCAFGPNGLADGHSPDRVDALVWALTTLLLNGSAPRVRGL
ncbi:MAG TPA: ATP-binding protein [Devosia sp.]|nr:ATP-binding protein [Devosia sp.]